MLNVLVQEYLKEKKQNSPAQTLPPFFLNPLTPHTPLQKESFL